MIIIIVIIIIIIIIIITIIIYLFIYLFFLITLWLKSPVEGSLNKGCMENFFFFTSFRKRSIYLTNVKKLEHCWSTKLESSRHECGGINWHGSAVAQITRNHLSREPTNSLCTTRKHISWQFFIMDSEVFKYLINHH